MTYSIRAFSEKIGVSMQTLRRWDQQERLVPFRTPGNRRFYTDAHIALVLRGPAPSTDAPLRPAEIGDVWLEPIEAGECIVRLTIDEQQSTTRWTLEGVKKALAWLQQVVAQEEGRTGYEWEHAPRRMGN